MGFQKYTYVHSEQIRKRVHKQISTCTYMCKDMYIYAYLYTRMLMSMCIYIYVYVCVCIHTCTYMYIYIYVYVQTHTHTHTHICLFWKGQGIWAPNFVGRELRSGAFRYVRLLASYQHLQAPPRELEPAVWTHCPRDFQWTPRKPLGSAKGLH